MTNSQIKYELVVIIFVVVESMDNVRKYKHLRNTTNRVIAKECYERRKMSFHAVGITDNMKWKLIKLDTGQQNFKTPEIIKEGNIVHTKP